jgi:hypothetical protein
MLGNSWVAGRQKASQHELSPLGLFQLRIWSAGVWLPHPALRQPASITIPIVWNSSVAHEHCNYTYPVTSTCNYCSCKLISAALACFLPILPHFTLHVIQCIHISYNCSILLHHISLLMPISASLFLNLLAKMWSLQILSASDNNVWFNSSS